MSLEQPPISKTDIDSFLSEQRLFPPPPEFAKRAQINSVEEYRRLYEEARKNPEAFWTARGREELYWNVPFTQALEWNPPHAKWFLGGQTNLAYNCLDRHLARRKDKVALLWEGEPGEVRRITYGELHAEVSRLANGLRSLGVKKGDRVGIYLPMIPEAAISLLACARIGAVHSLVFGGFSADALRERLIDAGAKVLITADGGYRRGAVVPLKKNADEAIKDVGTIDRFWDIIERHKVSILYTAPTAIRAFMRLGAEHVTKHNMLSLRLLGTVGEPINPEAWMWYREVIGGNRCPIVDTWWQTETGAIMIAPLPGAIPTKPGSATLPLPGIQPEILDKEGRPVPKGKGGLLFIAQPWPSMLRTIWGDPDRYVSTYFNEVPGKYFTGDGARQDQDGYFWLMGRVDDVLKVAGHRLGTMELESALVSEPRVSEAACVGKPDEIKGTAIVAFVTLRKGVALSPELKKELAAHVVKEMGAIARPDEIRFADALPKTRSGKIMRRLLRDIAAGRATTGDTTTLEDLSVLASLREEEE